jgi:hypothetical protein
MSGYFPLTASNPGPARWAVLSRANGDYFEGPTFPGDTLTMFGWLKLNGTEPNDYAKVMALSANTGISFYKTGANFTYASLSWFDGTNYASVGSYGVSIPVAGWNSILGVLRADGYGAIYANGALVLDGTPFGLPRVADGYGDSNFNLGAQYHTPTFDGGLGPCGVYTRALNAGEIAALHAWGPSTYSALPSALKDGLGGYWNMDESSGPRGDSVGTRTLTVHGTPGVGS